jgi:hypothetical protein
MNNLRRLLRGLFLDQVGADQNANRVLKVNTYSAGLTISSNQASSLDHSFLLLSSAPAARLPPKRLFREMH